MKLTSVEIHPANSSEVVVLSFRDPRRLNPYNVTGITGLDADEIVPRYYGNSGNSNDKFFNLVLTKRDIVVRVELNPVFVVDQTYSDLRDALYKVIASSRTGVVQLQFKNGAEVVAAISGFVSKFESPHFDKVPSVQLTINCQGSMLQALDPVNIPLPGLDPALTHIIDDKSTAPHGFKFQMVAGSVPSMKITDPSNDAWSFEVIPAGGGFHSGDIVFFSSDFNDKYLYLVRSGAVIYLADVITPGSMWPILFPGDNQLAFTNPTSFVWNDISYYPTYWGV